MGRIAAAIRSAGREQGRHAANRPRTPGDLRVRVGGGAGCERAGWEPWLAWHRPATSSLPAVVRHDAAHRQPFSQPMERQWLDESIPAGLEPWAAGLSPAGPRDRHALHDAELALPDMRFVDGDDVADASRRWCEQGGESEVGHGVSTTRHAVQSSSAGSSGVRPTASSASGGRRSMPTRTLPRCDADCARTTPCRVPDREETSELGFGTFLAACEVDRRPAGSSHRRTSGLQRQTGGRCSGPCGATADRPTAQWARDCQVAIYSTPSPAGDPVIDAPCSPRLARRSPTTPA